VSCRRYDSVVLGSRSSKVPDWQEKSLKVDLAWMATDGEVCFYWSEKENLHPRVIPLTDGRPHSLSFHFLSLSLSLSLSLEVEK